MYSIYNFNGKSYQFNTKQAFELGKDEFLAAHPGVPNAEEAWKKIEADSKVEDTADKKVKQPK